MTFDMCEEFSKSSATLPLSKNQTWFKIGPSSPFEIALQLWTASSIAQSTEGLVWPLTGAHLQWSSTLCKENGFTSHHVGDESWVSDSQTWRVLFRSSELSAVLTPCEREQPKAAGSLIGLCTVDCAHVLLGGNCAAHWWGNCVFWSQQQSSL